ncbi:hypothetical protein NQ314_008982 [Rhamnusium bicolor]|uniref:Uncharacterized protein n=1 Tax=Rhamnusium bicolor TaxID=1586634 RepID=A0AAV8Y554_9CUCU|nr:hypothetical protein NQ314_008982 [Rhamnusium bicolor]
MTGKNMSCSALIEKIYIVI